MNASDLHTQTIPRRLTYSQSFRPLCYYTNMDIVIRKAHKDELGTIQDLNYKLFLWDYERDPTLNINWPYEKAGEEYFKDKISGEKGVCFVATN